MRQVEDRRDLGIELLHVPERHRNVTDRLLHGLGDSITYVGCRVLSMNSARVDAVGEALRKVCTDLMEHRGRRFDLEYALGESNNTVEHAACGMLDRTPRLTGGQAPSEALDQR